MLAYARRLTLVWACLFVVLTVINLVLAVLADPGGLLLSVGLHSPVTVPLGAWSLFANVLNYLIVGALFVGEYWLRRRRFPQQSYRGSSTSRAALRGVRLAVPANGRDRLQLRGEESSLRPVRSGRYTDPDDPVGSGRSPTVR